MRYLTLPTLALLLGTAPAAPAADVQPDVYSVGVAEIDITPAHPIRLNGFGFRRAESEGVNHPIHARALAVQHEDDADPAVLITIDALGMPADLRAELAKRLEAKAKLPPERLAVAASHTHCGPMLKGANPTIFGEPIPKEHLQNIDRYTAVFLDKLEQVALAALKDRKPAKLFRGVGSVGFAVNRRARSGKPGPVDHDLPILVVRDAATNAVRAVYVTYACHCVTLSHNKIGGDWAGYAAEAIRGQNPGAVALVSIGCGADANPDTGVTGDKVDAAQAQGRQVAAEVKRLLGQYLAPVRGKIVAKMHSVELPLADLPTRAEWEAKAKRTDAIGHHARVQLARLDKGEPLTTKIDYPVQTWAFGDSLVMAHLPGEVVCDYAVRLRKELDRGRLWVTAYANNNPCYIPSERVLKEGGYEGGGAMVYYDLPVPFRPGLEDKIVGEVHRQLGKTFAPTFDANRTDGTTPLSPQQSLAAIRTRERLAVDLVAAEPLTADPVAIAFGPDGKLWVCEMLDYPEGTDGKYRPGGRVRVLEDRDGDGRFDTATTFLDKLPFPTGVTVWRKGVLVCAAPDILYAEDTDGDGRADKVTKLFSGFGTDNYQARVNGLAYGLDGWVYGSCGLLGGDILSHKTGKVLKLGDRDFRINPDTGAIEPATGRTQQGRVRDDWGDWFGCHNTNLGFHHALDDAYLRRNPHAVPPRPTVNVAAGPDPDRLFPVRQPQLFYLSGPAGRTTGACGIGVYRDDRLGAEFTGDTFTCEPVNLLVHRLKLTPTGATFAGHRPADEQDREFLASADGWCRPVQAVTGPDGALWVVDMYRFVIEHPRWIAPSDLARLDLRAGAGMGRVYRVRPADGPPRSWPRLDKLDAAGLVAALDSPNGWQRDMATELLAWRDEKSAVPLVEKLARECQRPEARLHALVALDRLGGLTATVVRPALADAHPGVRRHAVRLAEKFLGTEADIGTAIAKLADDADAQVRLQVAYSLGEWRDPRAGEVLAKLAARRPADGLLGAAVVSSLNRENFRAVVDKLASAAPAGGPPPLLEPLIATAVGLGDEAVFAPLVKLVTEPRDGRYAAWQFAAAESILNATGRAGKAKRPAEVARVIDAARAAAADAGGDAGVRVAAVRLLGREPAKLADDIARLAGLLGPRSPAALQSAAVAALARSRSDAAADALLAGWKGYSPALQGQVIAALLAREAWARKALAAIAAGSVPASAVDAPHRHRLLYLAPDDIRAAATKVFGTVSADRQKVIAQYADAAKSPGDAARGRLVFAKTCSPCHQLDGVGHAVGPDLAALANKTPAYLLSEILDPNRNLDSRYVEYTAALADGRTVTGLLASESSVGVVLRAADGKEATVLRADLESLRASGRSLMPEGLEKDVPPPAMADLIAYLTATQPPKPGAAEAAKVILDDARPAKEREAVIARYADAPADLIRALVADLPADAKEEYRRIPWVWRVAIAAGKRNDAGQLRDILAAALPKPGEPLRDWQAVVAGGGVINGVSMSHGWPGPRIKEVIGADKDLAARWDAALAAAVTMADDTKVPTGTRYDALRITPLLGWAKAGEQLKKYLAKGTHAELQMGAVSGLVDVDSPQATAALAGALEYLAGKNRELALEGLTRTEARAAALLDKIEQGGVKPDALPPATAKALAESKSEAVRARAAKLLGKK